MGTIVAHRDPQGRYWYVPDRGGGSFTIRFGPHGDERDRMVAVSLDREDADTLCRQANRREFTSDAELTAALACYFAAGGRQEVMDGPTGPAANEQDAARWLWQHAARLWEDKARGE